MSQIELGKLLTDGKEVHDAVHVAVMSAVAAHGLRPGEKVGVVDKTTTPITVGDALVCIGIVDPFLMSYVPRGSTFLVFMLPDKISNIRHHWDCVALDAKIPEPVTSSITNDKIAQAPVMSEVGDTRPLPDNWPDDAHSQWCRDEDC